MSDYGKYRELKIEKDGRLLTITLDRPEARNALTTGMHRELEEVWLDVAMDDEVGAIILTGSGDHAFCAGGDVKRMSERASGANGGGESPARGFISPKRLLATMLEVEQPIIGAINGHAMGLGATLALACDIIVANEEARLADTHVRVGLVAGDGGGVVWPMAMSIHLAKEYLFTGDPLLAKDAARLGIINHAVPYEEVMPKAREIALRLANGPTWAIRWTKTTVNKILRERLNLMMDTGLATEWLSMGTEDHREASRAFVERRQPGFKGR